MNLDVKFDVILFADVFEHIPIDKRFQLLQKLIKDNSHKNTYIYLNVPGYNFSQFIAERYPQKQQIIDTAQSISETVSLFETAGFTPIQMQIYGIDTDVQYNEYLFIHKDKLRNYYETELQAIYKE